MPDTDAPSRSDSNNASAPLERVNLPAVIPPAAQPEPVRDPGDSWLTRVMRAVFGWKPNSMRADLETVLENGASIESGFSPEERTMLKNILALRGRRIDDVMVPRADIISVQQDIPLGELIKVFEGAGHSRLVVYNETLDDPVGMVHIRDVIGYMVRHAQVDPAAKTRRKKPFPADLDLKAVDLGVALSAAKIIREILFVPPSMPAIDLLAKMQTTRIHLALVIDEYGGTDGIVSMEDIVEQIVGDIEDEHDDDEVPSVVPQADGSFLADARAPLEDVVAIVGSEFDVADVTDEVDTLAGYMMTRVGRLPSRGEVVPGPGDFEIEVLDADPRRLKKVRITRHKGRPARRERSAGPREAGARGETAPTASPLPESAPDKGAP
jgi:CBS domain containing-hemolysin-like protein